MLKLLNYTSASFCSFNLEESKHASPDLNVGPSSSLVINFKPPQPNELYFSLGAYNTALTITKIKN